MVDCSGRCVPDDVDQFKGTVGRLLSDGVCDDGVETRFDFDCETYMFDIGDCKGGGAGSSARVGGAESEALDALLKDPMSSDLLLAYVEARPESLDEVALGEKEFDELFEEARLNSLKLHMDSITKELLERSADGIARGGAVAPPLEKDRELLRELLKLLAEGKGDRSAKAWQKEQDKLKREIEMLRRSIKSRVEKGLNFDARREILAIQNSEDFDAKEKKRLIAEIIKAAGEEINEGGRGDGGGNEGLPGLNAGRRTTERKLGGGGLDPDMTLGKSIKHRKPVEISLSRDEDKREED
jgi:hypothetical protein